MKMMEEEVLFWLVMGAQSPGCLALPAATPCGHPVPTAAPEVPGGSEWFENLCPQGIQTGG